MKRVAAVVALLLVGALATACGDDDGGGGGEDVEASIIPPATAVSPTSATSVTTPAQDAFPPAPESCDASSASPAAAGEDLTLEVATPDEIVTGEIAWELTLTNTSDEDVDLVYPSGQDADVALRRGGQDVYRWSASQAFPEVIRCQRLGPGEQYPFALGGTSLVLEPGAYRLVATLAADPAPAPYRASVTLIAAEDD